VTACPLGKGDVDAECSSRVNIHLADVEAAIDTLVKDRPELFNLTDEASPGSYRVLDNEEYFSGVIANLQAKGFCAAKLGEQLQVKASNDLSEEYDILLSSGHIRRGVGSYLKTCTPAAFPLEPEDAIARMPILMYSMECRNREVPPRPFNSEIPVGCTGLMTATPKDKNNKDVDPRIHGPECRWYVREGEDFVHLEDFHEVPFNIKVVGRDPGEFIVCAVIVKDIEGCFYGKVVP
jgi:hypothetical protein